MSDEWLEENRHTRVTGGMESRSM